MAKMSAGIIKAAMEYKESCRDKWIDPTPDDKSFHPDEIMAYPPSEAIRWRIYLDYNGRRSY